METFQRASIWKMAPLSLFIFFFFFAPILFFGFKAFSSSYHLAELRDIYLCSAYWQILLHTVLYCFTATVVVTITSTPLALALAFGNNFWRTKIQNALLIPIILNPLVLILGWIYLLGHNSLLIYLLNLIGIGNLLFTPYAVIIGIVYLGMPFMVYPISNSMKGINTNTIYAARIIGASENQIFARIIFPLSIKGYITGFTIVFLISMGYFIVPSLLGGGQVDFFSTLIEQQANVTLDWSKASHLSLILVITTFTIIGIVNGILRKASHN